MSHDIEFKSDGSMRMCWDRRGGTPWHQGGKEVYNLATPEQVAEACGALPVRKQIIYVKDANGEMREWGSMRAIVRADGQQLAIVGLQKPAVQPVELYSTLHPLVERGEGYWSTAGVLRKGKTIWGQVALHNPKTSQVLPGDLIHPFVLATMSYDGRAIYIRFIETRVVCANTHAIAMNERVTETVLDRNTDNVSDDELAMERVNAIRIVHTGDVHSRLQQAQKILGIAHEAHERQMLLYKAFARARMSSAVMDAYFKRVIPDDESIDDQSKRERAREELKALAEIGEGTNIKGVRGTLWGAFNAVTEWVDHGRGGIGLPDPQPMKQLPDPSARLTSIFLGQGARIKARAYRVAAETIGAMGMVTV